MSFRVIKKLRGSWISSARGISSIGQLPRCQVELLCDNRPAGGINEFRKTASVAAASIGCEAMVVVTRSGISRSTC